uniref:Uncharacterized protein n=1 Tax=Calcidiscus leptoporus TaxID=127549 RepID=A0A7S0P5Z7_9EUKA|mmetsp:Transcript_8671/g.20284  ORF Transcript_8671/g.20284 Transcript_8671/m.20284 type:complete len:208 (+) Transcript_8671:3-626(+)
MGLPDTVDSRLMRTMIEAVKQTRLRREREEAEKSAHLEAEPLSARSGMPSAYPTTIRQVSELVNRAGDGNDWAIFIAAMLSAIGAHVRISVGCADAHARAACQLFSEVRLGKAPAKVSSWVRNGLPATRWLKQTYSYRLDVRGYVWLNLDWIDTQRIQRPGAPYKQWARSVWYDGALSWGAEGEEVDSEGEAKLRTSPVHTLPMGIR